LGEIKVGLAIDYLRELQPEQSYDLVFIDADKQSNLDYFIEAKRLTELNSIVEQRLMNYSTLFVERPEEQKKVELLEMSSPDRNARQFNSRCTPQFGHKYFLPSF